ncbi:Mss4-like protein [Cladorrhinum sp. PSN332]|nr:Mss4-like protein [Cladorrhinum sp. PSN332]
MADTESASKQKYRGSCHCGAFIFELEIPEIQSVMTCNCSICTKRGHIWVMPGVQPTIIKDEGTMVDYSFGSKKMAHRFCGKCGIAVLGVSDNYPPPMNVGVNARTLQNLDFYSLERTSYDGAALGTKYEPTPYTGPDPEPTHFTDGRVYHGSCHCGAVTAALKVPTSLEDKSYKELLVACNCSLCRRIGATWIYPTNTQLSIQGSENLTPYTFGHKSWRRWFCKTCGVYLYTDPNELTKEEVAALPEGARSFRDKMAHARPFNLQVLDGFDLGSIEAPVNDGWKNQKPEYVNP